MAPPSLKAEAFPPPVLDAMRKLDTKSNEPSLVRQLYVLALLNRDEAMRRMHFGLPPDVVLAQQPPSLLALARPSAPSSFQSAGFHLKPSTSTGVRPRRSRVFGAMSGAAEKGADAVQAISAARERAIPHFPPGYGVPPIGHERVSTRAQTANPFPSAPTRAPTFTAPASASASGLSSTSPSALLARPPLRPADLENAYPVRLSLYEPPSPEHRLEPSSGRRGKARLPTMALPVRELLATPPIRDPTPGKTPLVGYASYASLTSLEASANEGAVVGAGRPRPSLSQEQRQQLSGTGGGVGRAGFSFGGASTAPTMGGAQKPSFDAWAAAEEDLKYRAEQESRREEMRTVKTSIGRDDVGTIGF